MMTTPTALQTSSFKVPEGVPKPRLARGAARALGVGKIRGNHSYCFSRLSSY